jgi:O-antigen/teichoic acid export membrane protein
MQRFASIVARNSSLGAAAQIIIKLLSFGFSVLIVRLLGAEDFGQYAAITAFGALFLFIGDLGLSPYAIRQVARLRDQPDAEAQISSLYSDIVGLRLILTTLGCATMLVAAWLTGRPAIMIGAMTLNALGMLAYAIQGSSEAFLAGFERLDITAGARVIYQVVFVVLGAAALWFGLGYYGLIYGTLVSIAALTLICWRSLRQMGVRLGWPRASAWLTMLRASLPFGVIGFALGLSYKFDSVLLNIYHSDAETGYYNAAYNLIFSMVAISNVINTSLYPSLTRQAAHDPQTLPAIYERVLRYLLLLSLPLAVGTTVLVAPLVQLLFGVDYAAAVPVLQIIVWVVPLMFLAEFLGYIVVVANHEGQVARAVVVSTCVSVILNLALVPRYGLLAAAITTVLTEMILVGQYLWMLRDTLREARLSMLLLRVGIAAAVMGVLVAHLAWLPLGLSVLAGVLSYGLLILGLQVIGPDEWRFLRALRRSTPAPEGGRA